MVVGSGTGSGLTNAILPISKVEGALPAFHPGGRIRLNWKLEPPFGKGCIDGPAILPPAGFGTLLAPSRGIRRLTILPSLTDADEKVYSCDHVLLAPVVYAKPAEIPDPGYKVELGANTSRDKSW